MTDNISTGPIEVSSGNAMGQTGVGVRYALTALGAFALGRHWIADDTLQVMTVLATVLAPYAYGAYATWRGKRALVTVAAAAPDDVAVVK